MQLSLRNLSSSPLSNSIEPLKEMAAYESLWKENSSFKSIAELFAKHPGQRPSDLVSDEQIKIFISYLQQDIDMARDFNILIYSTLDYPKKLRDASEPLELLYYSGDLGLINTRSIAVVGTRKPTTEGLARAKQLVEKLVKDKFTIVSGLAEGIDTCAHQTAIENGGKTIAVIGTPLNEFYPKQNKELQQFISRRHLVISQVPFWKYKQQDYRINRFFFPERNKTMSAISEGTVIVEAGETSGTLIQARAALQQKRKLFILDSCFANPEITWPAKFEKLGAVRVRQYTDITSQLGLQNDKTSEN